MLPYGLLVSQTLLQRKIKMENRERKMEITGASIMNLTVFNVMYYFMCHYNWV